MMDNYILRTVDSDGNLVAESNLTLSEGQVIIQILPDFEYDMSYDNAQSIHNYLAKALKNKDGLITLLHGTKIQILDVKSQEDKIDLMIHAGDGTSAAKIGQEIGQAWQRVNASIANA